MSDQPLKNIRGIVDVEKQESVALPNADATVNTPPIDLEVEQPTPTTEKFLVEVETSAATGDDDKTITIALQQSDNPDSGWENIPELATLGVTEVGGEYPPTSRQVYLPPRAKRYIRATATGEVGGGNASDGTLTIRLLF